MDYRQRQCENASTHRNVHGKSLPPHLSPLNDEEENYVPEYRKKIKDLQVAAGVVSDDEDTKEEETNSMTRTRKRRIDQDHDAQ